MAPSMAPGMAPGRLAERRRIAFPTVLRDRGHGLVSGAGISPLPTFMRAVTHDEIKKAAAGAKEIAKDLNSLFKNNSVHHLVRTKQVAFCYHPEILNGNLGNAYKEGYETWMKGGALEQLMDILDCGPTFAAGSFGSVWFDVELTGGSGPNKRTKLTRVTPVSDREGGFNIILDATFDDEW